MECQGQTVPKTPSENRELKGAEERVASLVTFRGCAVRQRTATGAAPSAPGLAPALAVVQQSLCSFRLRAEIYSWGPARSVLKESQTPSANGDMLGDEAEHGVQAQN